MITNDGFEVHRGDEAHRYFGDKQEGDEVAIKPNGSWHPAHVGEGYSFAMYYRRRVQPAPVTEQMHFL